MRRFGGNGASSANRISSDGQQLVLLPVGGASDLARANGDATSYAPLLRAISAKLAARKYSDNLL